LNLLVVVVVVVVVVAVVVVAVVLLFFCCCFVVVVVVVAVGCYLPVCVYRIGIGFHLVWFFALDKHDEYQLCEFILRFKGTQFLSTGILPALIGGGLYYVCANRDSPNCDVWGEYSVCVSWVLCCVYVIVWELVNEAIRFLVLTFCFVLYLIM